MAFNAEKEIVPSGKLPPLLSAFVATPFHYPRTLQGALCLDYASILEWVESSECVCLLRYALSNLILNPFLFGL